MTKVLQSTMRRDPMEFVRDLAGALSLIVMLVGALHLPAVF